ncbi:DNA-binding protein [Pseudomonas fluorescens HK44]|uniref:DNA-binding protein n=1 Tax=Pseudomonas fluorescens HK44 TaxID=1042209 RepID=A0A010S5G2_PSEFL|nr:helix-turn-helix transcriptional regulator [Pseudomonas fluorescens]EXF95804.1 DNA-binding protein [Pseudomonas fluorescens HK44]
MNDTFADKLAYLRAQKGLTQRELAALTGIAWSMISKYESGQSKPRLKVLLRLAEALGVSSEDLLGIQESKPRDLSIGLPQDSLDELQRIADESGKSFKEVVSETLRWGLKMFKEDPEFAASIKRGIEESRELREKAK